LYTPVDHREKLSLSHLDDVLGSRCHYGFMKLERQTEIGKKKMKKNEIHGCSILYTVGADVIHPYI